MTTALDTAAAKRKQTNSSQPAAYLTGRLALLAALFAGGLLTFPAQVRGEGFRNPPAGSFDLGRAGGRIAQVDDNSAIAQNPANLVDVTNRQVNFTPSIVYIQVNYSGPSGAGDETKHPWKVLPNLFLSLPFHDGDYAAGLGITVPYGLANQWTGTDALRTAAPYYSELTTINFSPTFSMKLLDTLKLGVGFDVMWSHIRFNQFLPIFHFSELEVAGSGVGYGGNAGLTWQMTEHQRVALTYRSPMTIDYSGRSAITQSGPLNFAGGFNSQIAFPTIVSVGYGIDLTDNLRLESDVEWVQFSRFQSLPIGITPATPIPLPTSAAEHWHDTFTAGIGGDWKFAPGWTGRAGYQFYESPVPDNTYSPSIPDANQNVFTVGLNYTYKHHSFEGAYGLDFYDVRHINSDANPALNGAYQAHVHLFSVSYRYSF